MSEEHAASLFRGNIARLRLYYTPPPSPSAEIESPTTPHTAPQHYQVYDELESLFPSPSQPIIRRKPKCRRHLNFAHIVIHKNLKKKMELLKKVAQEQKQATAELPKDEFLKPTLPEKASKELVDAASTEQVDTASKEQVDAASKEQVEAASMQQVDTASYEQVDAASKEQVDAASKEQVDAS